MKGHIRTALATLVVVAALALPAAALAAGLSVKSTFPKSNPVANKLWPISLKVRDGGKKLSGTVHYNFLFEGAQVSTQKGHSFTGGTYTDKLKFPKKAEGITLTLQVVVVTKDGTKKIDHTVTTKA